MLSINLALAALAAAQAAAPATASNAPTVAAPPAQSTVSQPAEPVAEGAAVPAESETSTQTENPSERGESEFEEVTSSATPAVVPATTATGPILWRNIASAMTVADLRSLYPQGPNVHYKDDRTILSDVSIIEGCEAKVNIMHPAGVVQEIVMRGEGSLAGRCSLKLITALSGKYGESLEKDKVHASWLAREGKNYVWTRDGVTLQFKRYTNGAFGGGGLFAASWELRYSATASAIDL